MSNTIKIKRSQVTGTPVALVEGEMAYSELSELLFIGVSGANIQQIGGKDIVDRLIAIEGASGNYELVSNKAIANGYCPLDGGSRVPTEHLPPLAINDVFVVADQTEMLALDAQKGDMAIRQDNGLTYVLAETPASSLANWKEVTAAGQVVSVNGQTGVVALTYTDVGAAAADHDHEWADLTDPPATFPPSGHGHLLADVTDSGGLAAFDDAPTDGQEYVRRNGLWALNTGGSALPDAPSDGAFYGRRDAAWDTPAIADITGLANALDGKSDDTHEHNDLYYTETEVDALLAGKANASHTHPISQVTGLQNALDGKADDGHNHDSRYYTETEIDGILAGLSTSFVGLSDTPGSIAPNQLVFGNAAGDAIEFRDEIDGGTF